MAEFPALKDALFRWAEDASVRLSAESMAHDRGIDLGHWRRDSDGAFRDAERQMDIWGAPYLARQFELLSWQAVLDVVQEDSRLNDQIDAFVSTAQGGHYIEASNIGRRVLPRPDELDQFAKALEQHYEDLEAFLTADEVEYTIIWPLPGLTVARLPVQLETTLELDAMSDRELGFALDTEIVRTTFPRERLFNPGPEHRTCVRYRYSLPKVVGDLDVTERFRTGEEIENRLQGIESALKESLAIVLPDATGVAGRFGIVSDPASPLAGGIAFQQATLPQGPRLRRTGMSASQATEQLEVWQFIRQPGLLQQHKGLALALRRLSYQAQREQPEDELLDTMIAAEALYLTGMGDAAERGELRYRLALRAALWSDPEQTGFTRREVLGVMKSTYDARSAIAHGGTPKPEVMKVRGQRVPLPELAKTAKSIITAGCRAALARAASGGWPLTGTVWR